MQPALGIEAEVPATKHSATQRSEDLQRKARPLQRERPTGVCEKTTFPV